MSSSAHPADGDLRALLDDELPGALRLEVERHVATCAACRARLAVLEAAIQETRALFDLLPSPEPALRSDAIALRARRPRLRWGAIAAALMLTIATVAGATVGRPYVRALVARIRAVVHPVRPAAPAPPAQGQAGIAFVPGPSADIIFDEPQAAGVLHVSLADTPDLAIDPTASVTYRVHPGGVMVHNRGSAASYDIVVPRQAPHVRILVGGRVLFEKVGSAISAVVPAESTGQYVIRMR
jgi:anti-sigma factor RsiW